jgi:Trypsin-like peptidase domain/MAP3K TRAFs-binding domain
MATWVDPQEILDRIIAALDSFDWAETDRLCRTGEGSLLSRLDSATTPFPSREGLELLKRLRRKRRFELMAVLSDAFIRAGAPDAEARRQYGQALIDQGNLLAAETVLQDVLAGKDTPGRERDEALGLMGRIYKQQYVNACQPSNPRQQQNLAKAIHYYFEAFNRDRARNIWQGINYVALLARARADGVELPVFGDTGEAVLATVEAELTRRHNDAGELFYWDRAIDLEAAIARNQPDRIEEALHWYLRDERADAFEFASTLRQLREVWRLQSDTRPGDAVINGLNGAVLKRGGESVDVKSTDVRSILQKNFSAERDLPLKWWQTGLKRCTAIAQIEAPNGRHAGTGFLVNASEFFAHPGGDPVLLTNWHVVSKDGEDPLSIPPDDAVARFEACGEAGQVFRLKQVIAFNRRLDATFISLEPVSPDIGNCPLRVPPAEFDPKKGQRLYVIGYPGGRGLSFSLHDSRWLDSDGAKLHYRTPTEGGNSGSPVFDEDNWMLVGLHHAGSKEMPRLKGQAGTYEANEAYSVTAIREAIATSLMS